MCKPKKFISFQTAVVYNMYYLINMYYNILEELRNVEHINFRN